MGKEKGFSVTPLKSGELRRWLQRHGYAVIPGQHPHLKLQHPTLPMVLLPLQPSSAISLPAARQIAHALGLTNARALVEAVKRG